VRAEPRRPPAAGIGIRGGRGRGFAPPPARRRGSGHRCRRGGGRFLSGHLFLLIGPSGSGKTTLIGEVCGRVPQIRFVPTTTTRRPRPGEQDGREYFFVSDAEFDRLAAEDRFFEWKRIHGNRYGTPKDRITALLEAGGVGIMSVDIAGGLEIHGALPAQSTTVFVRPSSTEELRHRLTARAGSSEAEIDTRLERAERELAMASRCDFVITNDDGQLESAVAALLRIVAKRAPQLGDAAELPARR
jgi:guanylate kinase